MCKFLPDLPAKNPGDASGCNGPKACEADIIYLLEVVDNQNAL